MVECGPLHLTKRRPESQKWEHYRLIVSCMLLNCLQANKLGPTYKNNGKNIQYFTYFEISRKVTFVLSCREMNSIQLQSVSLVSGSRPQHNWENSTQAMDLENSVFHFLFLSVCLKRNTFYPKSICKKHFNINYESEMANDPLRLRTRGYGMNKIGSQETDSFFSFLPPCGSVA